MKRKVCFDTFGCRLNRAEALQEEARYLAAGWEVTTHHDKADVIVVRGCSVTSRAQHECEKAIAHIRHRYPLKHLVVQGCVNISLRTPAALDRIVPEAPDALPVRTSRAYLKIQDGCSGQCAFCIVPKFRGKSVSVDADAVLDKARRFIDAGYHEIVVTGCNLALYASAGKRLPEITQALASLDPTCRVRIGSVEPGACAHALVSVMAETPNICRFLHLPIQSGSPKILSSMRRPYTLKDVEDLIDEAVRLMPDLGLGCDLMTGYPGETNLDFVATQGLLERLPFSNAHVFPYSERPGTLAAGLPGQVHHADRSARAHALSHIARKKRADFARGFIGKNVDIVIEDAQTNAGWTSEYLWCKIPKSAHASVEEKPARKALVHAQVTRAKDGALVAVPRSATHA